MIASRCEEVSESAYVYVCVNPHCSQERFRNYSILSQDKTASKDEWKFAKNVVEDSNVMRGYKPISSSWIYRPDVVVIDVFEPSLQG